MSVDNERKEGYGETGCNKAISVDGGVLCVMNEGLEGLKEMLARDGVCWFGGGGLVNGWVKEYSGKGV